MDQEVDISTVTQVVSSIQRVVADFYGPQCSQTLMTSSTGKAVVSSDGMTILEALQPEHPVANLVFLALKNCYSVTLDGSKLFLLYLTNMLVYLQQEMDQASFQQGGTNLKLDNASQRKQSILCVRRSVRELINVVIPELYRSVFDHCRSIHVEKMNRNVSLHDVMKNILTTAMMPHCSVPQSEFYSQLLLSCLPVDENYKTLAETLLLMVDNFNSIVIKVSNRPYKDCAAVKMLLIKQTFKIKHQKVLTCSKLSAVILNSVSNFIAADDAKEFMMIKESHTIEKLLECQRNLVEKFAQACFQKNINIVLCTGSLPNYAVDILSRYEICVVTNMLDELEMLQICSGKVILNDLSDVIEEMNVITLSDVTEVVVGGRQYIQLHMGADLRSLKHLIVCAPTVGLCDQLAVTLLKALNALKLSLKPDTNFCACYSEPVLTNTSNDNIDTATSGKGDLHVRLRDMELSSKDGVNDRDLQNDDIRPCFAVIEGGTSFEILMAEKLKIYAKDCSDSNLSIVCKVLGRTMYSVVQKLYDNTSIQPRNKQNFLMIETLLKEKVSNECLWGLDRRGVPCSLLDTGVMEPVIIKTHTLNCVLNVVCQLLGVDKIVSVKKIKDD